MPISASKNAKNLKAKTRKKAKAAPAKKAEVKKAVVKKSTTTSGKVGTAPKNAPKKPKPMTNRAKATPDGKTDHGKSGGIFGKKGLTKSEEKLIQKASDLLKSYGKGAGRLGDKR